MAATVELELEDLHQRCGIYTKPEVARRILDAVGWHDEHDLSNSMLLEPAAGDGVFLVEAARRLVSSFERHGHALTVATLGPRIVGYEIAPSAAESARCRLVDALSSAGVSPRTTQACVRRWVRTSDFLLTELETHPFTHVVGNPPYVRWSNLPEGMRSCYEKALPRTMTGGDLFIPFLDRALDVLAPRGSCGFLCTDRWRYMAFAEHFRRKWLPQLDILEESAVDSKEAYQIAVGVSPSVLVAKRRIRPQKAPTHSVPKRGVTLADLGCRIRVGPALGTSSAFVLTENEQDVEEELLVPWIRPSEIAEGAIELSGRRVIAMHAEDGELRDLARYPLLRARLERHKKDLSRRAIVQKNGAPWFRPIDCVRASDWASPKLLVPEIARVPRLAVDPSGAIPSHGVYAIFPPEGEVDAVFERLRNGRLAAALDGIAPTLKNGYVRCYKRFLSMMLLPS